MLCAYTHAKLKLNVPWNSALKLKPLKERFLQSVQAFLYKRKNCLSIAAVQIWIKAPTIRSFFLKNTDIL